MLPFGVSVPDLGMTLLKLLAVAGGLAVGMLGTGWLVQLVCRLTIQRKAPQPVLRVLRGLGGLALGLAVWLWVFGHGGTGGFGGSGFNLFGGAGNGNGTQQGADAAKKEKKDDNEKERPKPDEILRVVMLGGPRVSADRFYLIENDKQPFTLADVEKAIKNHQPPVKEIEVVIYLDSVPEMHSEVARLIQRARDLELRVHITKPGTNMPN